MWYIKEIGGIMKKFNSEIIKAIKSMGNNGISAIPTFISIDSRNGMIIETFQKIIDYSREKIVVMASNKNICVYGENIIVKSFSKSEIQLEGKIQKIEFFEVK